MVVVPAFLDWLEGVRGEFGEPIIVNDGTRSAARQIEKTGRSTGAHVDGMAIDAGCHGEEAHRLMKIAFGHGVLGIGVEQNGALPFEKRYLHLDMWTKAPSGLRPRPWSY